MSISKWENKKMGMRREEGGVRRSMSELPNRFYLVV